MPDSDWSNQIDGSIGDLGCVKKEHDPATLKLPIQVSVRSDASSDIRATALADDIKRLVEEAFLKDSSSMSIEASTDRPADSEQNDDIQVRIHVELPHGVKDKLVAEIKTLYRTFFAEEA
jgi:hypothetical protein